MLSFNILLVKTYLGDKWKFHSFTVIQLRALSVSIPIVLFTSLSAETTIYIFKVCIIFAESSNRFRQQFSRIQLHRAFLITNCPEIILSFVISSHLLYLLFFHILVCFRVIFTSFGLTFSIVPVSSLLAASFVWASLSVPSN